MNNKKSVNLLYNYAVIDENCLCTSCMTYSYEVLLDFYIPVPDARDEYVDKYYNRDVDLWYEDSAMTIEATEVNEMYHG